MNEDTHGSSVLGLLNQHVPRALTRKFLSPETTVKLISNQVLINKRAFFFLSRYNVSGHT